MRRVAIVGVTGSGKSTLARTLAKRLGLPAIELDDLFWQPDWAEPAPADFRARVDAATSAPGWVAAGNYSRVHDLVWDRADTIVWLDFPFFITFPRLLRRTLRRIRTDEAVCNGNRETVAKTFLSRDSILVWSITNHRPHKTTTAPALVAAAARGTMVHRFQRPGEVAAWLASAL